MKEQIQFKGYWFRPLDPANKIAGILNFTPYEKIKLELIGGFEQSVDFIKKLATNEESTESIIWGIDEDAKKITLVNCLRYGKLNLSSEFPMTSYVVSFAIRGIHLERWNQMTFFKADIALPLLTNWINFNRIKFSMPYSNDESRWLGFDMKFRTDDFEDTSVQIDENICLTFRHGCTLPDIHSNKSVLEESYSLELQTNKDLDFWWLISKAKRFSNFLTLACGSEIDFTKILLFSKTRSQEISTGKTLFHPIELYYKQHKPATNQENHKFTDFLFEYANVVDELPTIIKKWYEFDDSMLPIIQHLIDSINNKSTFRSVDFLIICQALEGFHRRFVNKGDLILRTRLSQLIEGFDIITDIKNIPVQIVVNSRNYYSHLYEEDGREVYKDSNLYNLTKSLRALLTCHLLYKIGLSMDKIEKIINK